MKVLYIVTGFARSDRDVMTPWMIEIIRQLQRQGVEVVIYTSSWKGLGDQVVFGIPVRRFRYFLRPWELLSHEDSVPEQVRRNRLYALLIPFYLLFGIIGLRRVLRLERPDLIHAHWPFPLGLFGYFARRWSGKPLVTQFYGVELRWVRTKMKPLVPFLRWVAGTSDLVAAISSHTRNEVLAVRPGTAVEIIPYGSPIPPAPAPPAEPPDPARTRRVLFVGRLVERKGVEYLLRALLEPPLQDAPWPVELEIVGTGPSEAGLRELVRSLGLEGRARLTGRVPTVELQAAYDRCDVFVLPAIIDSKGDTEGLGVVLLEALNYYKPVVASGLGGIVDVVKDGQTGLLVPEKDPSALAAALRRVLEDEALARRLGAQGHRFARDYFDSGRIAARWKELYQELLGRG